MAKSSIKEAQAGFYHRYLAAVRAITGGLPLTEHDPEGRSPCVAGAVDEEGMVPWRPVPREVAGDVSALEEALGEALHPDTHAWISRWYCLPIEAAWGDETVVLFGAPDDADLERFTTAAARFVEELRREGRASVPIAVLHDGRRVTVENATGAVLLEAQGEAPRHLAASLAVFLEGLAPLPI